ncbi:MAG: hypothetical protein ACKOF9_10380 [Burkholderiales bacterium]
MSHNKPTPVVPNALALSQALERSAPLSLLRRRLQDSNQRFAVIERLLPPLLLPHVQPGPVDEDGWSLLAANAAVAAKLRQLQPRLEAQLREQGWQTNLIRIKVQGKR